MKGHILFVAASILFGTAGPTWGNFLNFETAPVHPLALSPDGTLLAACNLPDGRVELFSLSNAFPVPCGNIPVGVDPVSLRFRGTNEVWVVNFISSSINVLDLSKRRVVATLNTLAGPADVVFAGSPERAFVSCARSNAVMVFDPVTRTHLGTLPIDGDMPKAMAVSPDGTKVYVNIFESGNASTILAPRVTALDIVPGPSVVDDTNGPYAGQNPPPNSGSTIVPPINSNLTNPPPRVSHIVKKNAAGRWMDDNNGDWTEFVSGTNAALSGRVPGWDMPDHDVAVIDTTLLSVSYLRGLMNICMGVAVNPVSGVVSVIGTDGTNERRFEPNLQSVFLRVNLALVNPTNGSKVIKDLNPHLNYTVHSVPQSERDKSLGDPRGIVWSADGTRAFVSGMGSRNIIVMDANGDRVQTQPIDVGDGPTGLALDEARQQLYVLNRFSSTLAVVNTATLSVTTNLPIFDPTPTPIKIGRKHLYDTRLNSGLGHVSCASCHVDGRFDRLAWDLGDPTLLMQTNDSAAVSHPMKGPMVTQTFQDMGSAPPLHWRGDRNTLADFNQTFMNLLGRDTLLTPQELSDPIESEFPDLLNTIAFPPNPLRTFDNRLSTNVPLPGHFVASLGANAAPPIPLPNGNARAGASSFANCSSCHNPHTGRAENPGSPFGDGDFRLNSRSGQPFFKNAQLRSLPEKLGLSLLQTNSRAGFGFMHDGRSDTLSRFLADSFAITNAQETADLVAFLLSFTGSGPDMERAGRQDSRNPSVDAPASLGRQISFTNPPPLSTVLPFLELAESDSGLDLIARGMKGGVNRSWSYDAANGVFASDRNSEFILAPALLALASPQTELSLMLVTRGAGRRLAIDRDLDGFADATEAETGFDSGDGGSRPEDEPPSLIASTLVLAPFFVGLPSDQPVKLHAQYQFACTITATRLLPAGGTEPIPNPRFKLLRVPLDGLSINATNGRLTWTPTLAQVGQSLRVVIGVGQGGLDDLNDLQTNLWTMSAVFEVIPPFNVESIHLLHRVTSFSRGVLVSETHATRHSYQLQFTDTLSPPNWQNLGSPNYNADLDWPLHPKRFYRLQIIPPNY